MILESDHIVCMFCMCEMRILNTDLNPIKNHMEYEHGIMFNIKYVIASCFVDAAEIEAIADEVIEKLDLKLECDSDTVMDTIDNINDISQSKKFENLFKNSGKIDKSEIQKAAIYRILEDENEAEEHHDELLMQEDIQENLNNAYILKLENFSIDSSTSSKKFTCNVCHVTINKKSRNRHMQRLHNKNKTESIQSESIKKKQTEPTFVLPSPSDIALEELESFSK